ncbi:MAG: acyltransferase [Polaromonas sp.]
MKRIESVDLFRLLAILAVIIIHTGPFQFSTWQGSGLLPLAFTANQLARFAVPLFFVLSGYFWGRRIQGGADVVAVSISMMKRIFFVFIAWSLIYLLPYNLNLIAQHGFLGSVKLAYLNFLLLIDNPLTVIFEGTKGHLWFLSSLLGSIAISALFIAHKRPRILMALSAVLYIFGLLAKAYANTPIGFDIEFNTRNGPFFGLLLFSSGYLLSRMEPNPGWFSKGVMLLIFGYAMHFSELYLLHTCFSTSPLQDYVAGTYLTGLGSAMMALSNPNFLKIRAFSKAGQLTLGIYAVHVIVIENLLPMRQPASSPFFDIGFVLAVFFFSIAAALLMSKSKALRSIVV